MELESLTKSSVNDLAEGLIEVFHGILSDLIQINRASRNTSTISNARMTAVGDEKQLEAMNYNLDTLEPEFTNFDTICNENAFTEFNSIRAKELEQLTKHNLSGQPFE